MNMNTNITMSMATPVAAATITATSMSTNITTNTAIPVAAATITAMHILMKNIVMYVDRALQTVPASCLMLTISNTFTFLKILDVPTVLPRWNEASISLPV